MQYTLTFLTLLSLNCGGRANSLFPLACSVYLVVHEIEGSQEFSPQLLEAFRQEVLDPPSLEALDLSLGLSELLAILLLQLLLDLLLQPVLDVVPIMVVFYK